MTIVHNAISYACFINDATDACITIAHYPHLLSCEDCDGYIPLHYAGMFAQTDAMRARLIGIIIDAMCVYGIESDIIVSAHNGENIVHILARIGDVQLLVHILSYSQIIRGVHARTCDGSMPFHYACLYGGVACMQLLYPYYDATSIPLYDGTYPLFLVVESADEARLLFLLACGVDVHVRNALRMTALHIAAGTNNIALISRLVAAGCDVAARSVYGEQPFDIARRQHQGRTHTKRMRNIAALWRSYGA